MKRTAAGLVLLFSAIVSAGATVLECTEGPGSEHLAATGLVKSLGAVYANPDPPKPQQASSAQTIGILSVACAGLMALRRTRGK